MPNLANSAYVINQVRHWLATPTNAYLGSDYGIDLKSYLHRPMSVFDGDAIIAKMRHDIPILESIPASAINIYFQDEGIDAKKLHITIGHNTATLNLVTTGTPE